MSPLKLTKVVDIPEDELGLVLGYVIVCESGGEPYVDLQGHHIPENVMLSAALDFAKSSRVLKVMHEGEVAGEVVFMWPLTTDVLEAFELKSDVTGLMVGVSPSDAETLEKFRSGELAGFSLGGVGWTDEEDAG